MNYSKSVALVIIGTFLIVFLKPMTSFAQEHEHEEAFKHHRVSIVLGHTHIPQGYHSDSSSLALIVPSWGLNYEYWFSQKWAVGLHNDLEISVYAIEDKNGEHLARTRPIIISLLGIYKPWRGLELLAGFGREFEEHQNFWVYRFALEYEIEIGNHWDLAPALVVDIKENLYNSFTIGLVIGKRF